MNLITNIFKHVLLSCLAVALLSAGSQAQPVNWSKTYAATPQVKITRDSAGSIYVVSATPITMGGRKFVTEKYSASGVLIWSRTDDYYSRPEDQAEILQVTATSSHLLYRYHERPPGSTSTPAFSGWKMMSAADGSSQYGVSSASTHYVSIAANSQQFVYLLRQSSGDLFLTFYDLTTLPPTFINTFNLGQTEPIGEVKIDATNTAVAATYNKTTGHTRMVKASAINGLILDHEFDYPARTEEKPVRMDWDTVAQRAYVLADSTYAVGDTDPILFIWNTETGTLVHQSTVRASTGLDYPGDLSMIPGQGVYVSAFNAATDQRTILRKDVNGAAMFANTISLASTPTSKLTHVVDSASNLVVASDATNPNYLVDRYDASSGSIISRFYVPLSIATPQQMFTDAAGNLYMNVLASPGSLVQKIQPAKLTFSANNVTGGSAVNATIQLASPALSDQLWTITSGNTALVTAPATATVPTGATSVVVPLTVKGATSATNVSLNVRFAGYIEQQNLTVVPSVPQSVTAMPQVTLGGIEVAGTVQMTGQAKAGGQTVNLSSNKPLVASVPASVNIPEGASSANFAITTYGVNANQGVVITASSGAVQKTVFIAVNAPALSSLALNSSTIKGGVTGILTVNISGSAPTGGFAIALFSGAPGIVMLPAQTTVNAGNTSRNVSMPTAPVTATTSVLIFATRSGIYKTTTLTVTP